MKKLRSVWCWSGSLLSEPLLSVLLWSFWACVWATFVSLWGLRWATVCMVLVWVAVLWATFVGAAVVVLGVRWGRLCVTLGVTLGHFLCHFLRRFGNLRYVWFWSGSLLSGPRLSVLLW